MRCSICKVEDHTKCLCKTNTIIPKAEQIVLTIYPISKLERINRLKDHLIIIKIKHEQQIMELTTLKDAHIYCVIHNIPSQQYGALLEKYILTKFNYIKLKAEHCVGDCCKDNTNIEVKVSLGGEKHQKFNFVQIRLSHRCDMYILTAYNLSNENVEAEGDLYIFKVPKYDIKKIIMSFGTYAHGTIKQHGVITPDSLNNKNNIKEYAIRPKINDGCWKALLPFRVFEEEL